MRQRAVERTDLRKFVFTLIRQFNPAFEVENPERSPGIIWPLKKLDHVSFHEGGSLHKNMWLCRNVDCGKSFRGFWRVKARRDNNTMLFAVMQDSLSVRNPELAGSHRNRPRCDDDEEARNESRFILSIPLFPA